MFLQNQSTELVNHNHGVGTLKATDSGHKHSFGIMAGGSGYPTTGLDGGSDWWYPNAYIGETESGKAQITMSGDTEYKNISAETRPLNFTMKIWRRTA